MSKGTVVIVGAGGGGLACGALLGKNGYKVTIIERDSVVGGKAKSSEFNGYWIDEEFHSMVKVGENKAHRDRVGAAVGYVPEVQYFSDSVPILITPQNDVVKLPEVFPACPEYSRNTFKKVYGDYYNDADIDAIEKFAHWMMDDIVKKREAIKGKSIDDYKRMFPYIGMKDFAEQNTDNKQVQLWIQRLGGLTYNLQSTSRNALSTYIVINHILSLTSRWFTYVFPTHPTYGGLAALWEPYADIIRENGGEIRLETSVKKIVVKDGKAKGIMLENGEFIEADYVVCNMGPHVAVGHGLLDLNEFPQEYKQNIDSLISDTADMAAQFNVLTFNLALCLDKRMTDIDYCTLVDEHGDPLATIQTSSEIAPRSAPPGKQKIQLHLYLDGHPMWSHSVAEDYSYQVIMPRMRTWLPDIDRHIESQITYLSPAGTFGPMMNQMFGKPVFSPEKTPMDNFYFVGMFTGNVGMEGILLSGSRVAEAITGKKLIED